MHVYCGGRDDPTDTTGGSGARGTIDGGSEMMRSQMEAGGQRSLHISSI